MTLDVSLRDSSIRLALIEYLREYANLSQQTLMMEELGIRHGAARIDIVTLGDEIHGYEIKSDRDSLMRLAGQAGLYGDVLERITIVVGEKHLRAIVGRVPSWWGIALCFRSRRGTIHISTVRRSKRNPSIDRVALAELLWRDEALDILKSVGAADGMYSSPRAELYSRLATILELDELRSLIIDAITRRADWRAVERLV